MLSRELSPDLTSLVKEIDKSLKKEKEARGVFVLLDANTRANRDKLAKLATKEKISMPLTINQRGKKDPYKLNADATHIAILYKNKKAVKSFAFKKITEKDVKEVVNAAKKMFES